MNSMFNHRCKKSLVNASNLNEIWKFNRKKKKTKRIRNHTHWISSDEDGNLPHFLIFSVNNFRLLFNLERKHFICFIFSFLFHWFFFRIFISDWSPFPKPTIRTIFFTIFCSFSSSSRSGSGFLLEFSFCPNSWPPITFCREDAAHFGTLLVGTSVHWRSFSRLPCPIFSNCVVSLCHVPRVCQ